MVIIGMAVLFGAYTIGIWGYCLLQGYDVPFTSLFKSDWTAGNSSSPKQQSPGLPTDPGTGITNL